MSNNNNNHDQADASLSASSSDARVKKHSLEAADSWTGHVERQAAHRQRLLLQEEKKDIDDETLLNGKVRRGRHLKHHHAHAKASASSSFAATDDAVALEAQKERDFWSDYEAKERQEQQSQKQALQKHDLLLQQMYRHPELPKTSNTTHGIMIDAGSTGSRLHVYEWEPRVLKSARDVQHAVAGETLSVPGTESRWTDRLRPGVADFSTIQDDTELEQAIADYLKPLLDFAVSVLHTKREFFGDYPIYLRATAGARILSATDRARVMTAIRNVLQNPAHNPFQFARPEQARTLSGEEEAIYDWTGVNFLLGDLVQQSHGAGAVAHPTRKTHGALDLGGGSTQISFFEPNEDVMSNLFKLQIGQAKHWNLYAHSFLFYGMNEAIHRHGARLASGKSSKERIVDGIYDPCLPAGSQQDIRTNIHITNGANTETWDYANETYPSGNGFYQATLFNDASSAATVNGVSANDDVQACLALAKDLLHLEKNDWCDFAHKGDCSLAGVYQPKLPDLSLDSVGEFIAFSNYYHVWQFLDLPERATIQQLYDATQEACALDLKTLQRRNILKGKHHSVKEIVPEQDLPSYCFRSAYVYNLLHHGYGFQMQDTIRVSKVINGQKVGWALGAMLYEINALPWSYQEEEHSGSTAEELPPSVPLEPTHNTASPIAVFMIFVAVAMVVALTSVFCLRRRRHRMYQEQYEPIKQFEMENDEHIHQQEVGEAKRLLPKRNSNGNNRTTPPRTNQRG